MLGVSYYHGQASDIRLYNGIYNHRDVSTKAVLSHQEFYRQNSDKMRTYNMARVQYAHVPSILFVDADELVFCEGKHDAIEKYAEQHQAIMTNLATNADEVLFHREAVFGKYPSDVTSIDTLDALNNLTMKCMQNGYSYRSLAMMLSCWGQVNYTVKFDKALDVSGICPFHYNHWACTPSYSTELPVR